MALTDKQKHRYNRHIILDEVGQAGQRKLLDSKVLIIGLGGLGSPVALYLAAAGVGTIGLVDADKVDLTNLQRQVIHNTYDIGVEKVKSAGAKIKAINPDAAVKTYPCILTADNAGEIIRNYDFIVDATDNFPSKFLINDACYFEKKPMSHAGVLKFFGQLMTILPGKSACYRCVFGSVPPANAALACSRAGVFGVLPGVIGSLQATEAVKYLLEIGELLTDKLLTYNALTMEFRTVPLKRNPSCVLCSSKREITGLTDYQQPG